MFEPTDSIPEIENWRARARRGSALRQKSMLWQRKHELREFAKYAVVEYLNGADYDEIVDSWLSLESKE